MKLKKASYDMLEIRVWIALFPGPTQLSIACSIVHMREEPGNEA